MMPSSSPSPSSTRSERSTKKPLRQRPGSACLGCRGKKLKCDGKQPRCGTCMASGTECIPPTSPMQRGPKKGHLRNLQNRIDTLERQLLEAQKAPMHDIANLGLDLDKSFCLSTDFAFETPQIPLPPAHISLSENAISEHKTEDPSAIHALTLSEDMGSEENHSVRPIGLPGNLNDSSSNSIQPLALTAALSDPIPAFVLPGTMNEDPTEMQTIGRLDGFETPADFVISDLVRTDLDQLYFERIHHCVPILNRSRYFSWARSLAKTQSQTCLQYAVWTSAASLSSNLQHLRESLYRKTLKVLELLESKDEVLPSVEHVQTRILILIYDLMRTNHQRGWMSAGHCFRLMQMMRLHEVDCISNVARRKSVHNEDDWFQTEELRRAFWVAYSLDLFVSLRGGLPLTLHEHAVFTRLPMPEDDFQNGNFVEMPCLSESLGSLDRTVSSPFIECIVITTIFRHVLAHQRRSARDGISSNALLKEFWDRHNRLSKTLKTRTDSIALHYSIPLQHSHPMLLFTNMTAQAITLYLCNTVESLHCETEGHQKAMTAFRLRSLIAAREIVKFAGSHAQLSYLKMHPFTPVPLGICAEFLNAHLQFDDAAGPQAQQIYDFLRDMSGVNNLAQDYLS